MFAKTNLAWTNSARYPTSEKSLRTSCRNQNYFGGGGFNVCQDQLSVNQLGMLPNFFPISVCCQLLLDKFLLCCVEVLKSHIEQAAEKSELFGGGGFNVCQDQLSVSQLLADNCLLCCFCNQKKSKHWKVTFPSSQFSVWKRLWSNFPVSQLVNLNVPNFSDSITFFMNSWLWMNKWVYFR